jgi:hypothetical protein
MSVLSPNYIRQHCDERERDAHKSDARKTTIKLIKPHHAVERSDGCSAPTSGEDGRELYVAGDRMGPIKSSGSLVEAAPSSSTAETNCFSRRHRAVKEKATPEQYA